MAVRPWYNMMMMVQGRSDACMAGLAATVDQDGTAGTAGGALLVRENTMIACTPSGAALCNLTQKYHEVQLLA